MAFRAFVVNKTDDEFSLTVELMEDAQLPEGDVTVAVEWSDLNYKDGLACTPQRPGRDRLPDGSRDRLRRHGR